MIEKLLGDLLESFLIEGKDSHQLIWKDSHSSLGEFSGRAKLSFTLGLINLAEFRACNSIRRIRNGAAHNWKISLLSPEFRKLIPEFESLYKQYHEDLFVWIEDLEFLTKQIYAVACGMLAGMLAQRIVEAKADRRAAKDKLA